MNWSPKVWNTVYYILRNIILIECTYVLQGQTLKFVPGVKNLSVILNSKLIVWNTYYKQFKNDKPYKTLYEPLIRRHVKFPIWDSSYYIFHNFKIRSNTFIVHATSGMIADTCNIIHRYVFLFLHLFFD